MAAMFTTARLFKTLVDVFARLLVRKKSVAIAAGTLRSRPSGATVVLTTGVVNAALMYFLYIDAETGSPVTGELVARMARAAVRAERVDAVVGAAVLGQALVHVGLALRTLVTGRADAVRLAELPAVPATAAAVKALRGVHVSQRSLQACFLASAPRPALATSVSSGVPTLQSVFVRHIVNCPRLVLEALRLCVGAVGDPYLHHLRACSPARLRNTHRL